MSEPQTSPGSGEAPIGTLVGVGVGPGDPQLLTLAAVAAITGSPVVAFAPSKQLVTLAGQAATAAGYRVGYIVGGQRPSERTTAIDAFQTGQLDLICVTTGGS